MFYGGGSKVYIVDKVENNPVTVNGKTGTHPAWAVEYDFDTNTCQLIPVRHFTLRYYERYKLTRRSSDGCAKQYVLRRWFGFG
jgi:hypothetical protein